MLNHAYKRKIVYMVTGLTFVIQRKMVHYDYGPHIRDSAQNGSLGIL